jgi:hypothetical protein
VTPPEVPQYAGRPSAGEERSVVKILEGMHIHQRPDRVPDLTNSDLLSTHVLFLGGIGAGKTNAMKHFIAQLRNTSGPDDVFVIFDTKGDFLRTFRRRDDAVISSAGKGEPGGVVWNLFRDLTDDREVREKEASRLREEEAYEIATTIFSDQLSDAGENKFFAAGARDIFASVVGAMAAGNEYPAGPSNKDLREELEGSAQELAILLEHDPGTVRFLDPDGGGSYVQSVLAFLQETMRTSFSGIFREPGDFSVRQFIQGRGGRALFIEYDIASGASLLPVYRVLMDMAIKEALGLGRRRLQAAQKPPNFYFVLDEFALLPQLTHMADGVNFGRELGLKFLVATQNVNQVMRAYSAEMGESILSGFGTVLAFRLVDEASRALLRQRYGANRKQVTTLSPVFSAGAQQKIFTGNVIEDWDVSGLPKGRCIASLPQEPPFFMSFPRLA